MRFTCRLLVFLLLGSVCTAILASTREEERREEGSGEVVLARSGGEARNEAAVSSESGNRIPVPSRYANAC